MAVNLRPKRGCLCSRLQGQMVSGSQPFVIMKLSSLLGSVNCAELKCAVAPESRESCLHVFLGPRKDWK